MASDLITPADVLAARVVHAGRLHRTPMQHSQYLAERAGTDVWLKLESFQKTGSYKSRGVLNNIHHISDADKRKGVISLSAGNHAAALAWAARAIGVSATIVMPATAVQSKVDATRGYGGEVIQTDKPLMDTTLALQKERGLTLVHPFDHPMTMAGTGTVGLEILEDLPDVDAVLMGCGGGGLLGGVAAYLKQMRPGIRIIGVEPEGALKMGPSRLKGEPVPPAFLNTIADGLAAPFVGKSNLAHVIAFVDDMVVVNDAQISAAVRILLERCKVLAEPAAAACVAALLNGAAGSAKRVCCIISGGNMDLARLKQLL